MALRIDDRWLWLGFGVFLFVAARQIRHGISETVWLTEIDPAQYLESERKDDKPPEDAISIDTLKTLSQSPNPNIANSAISLIVTRFAGSKDASQVLAKDAYSSDHVLRQQARTAIAFLKDWPLPPGSERDPSLDMPWTPTRMRTNSDSRGIGLDSDDEDGGLGMDWGVDWTPESLPDLVGQGVLDTDTSPTLVGRPGMEVLGGLGVRPRAATVSSEAEAERRRRRREAMVLHEGNGRVEEGDIIRPR